MHHYTESGLENVYLKNGFKKKSDETISIPNIIQMHNCVSKFLIGYFKINGKVLRFLRTELGKNKAQMARILGCDISIIDSIENSEEKILTGNPEDKLRQHENFFNTDCKKVNTWNTKKVSILLHYRKGNWIAQPMKIGKSK